MEKKNSDQSAMRIRRLGSVMFSVGAIAAVLTIPAAYAGVLPVWAALTLATAEGLIAGCGFILKE